MPTQCIRCNASGLHPLSSPPHACADMQWWTSQCVPGIRDGPIALTLPYLPDMYAVVDKTVRALGITFCPAPLAAGGGGGGAGPGGGGGAGGGCH